MQLSTLYPHAQIDQGIWADYYGRFFLQISSSKEQMPTTSFYQSDKLMNNNKGYMICFSLT